MTAAYGEFDSTGADDEPASAGSPALTIVCGGSGRALKAAQREAVARRAIEPRRPANGPQEILKDNVNAKSAQATLHFQNLVVLLSELLTDATVTVIARVLLWLLSLPPATVAAAVATRLTRRRRIEARHD